ncbi:MAG: tRNA glutamyl-Q(34) synthetase GluQRS [Varibaculum sp.]|nr:tRNA glutamyl-Q(34) synthetase GluQRS [Varibaculum sp.]
MAQQQGKGAGRFAPTPSGELHIGNLRTAMLAWAAARNTGRAFLIRMEDTDRALPGAAQQQLRDLRQLGIDWDSEPLFQTTRSAAYTAAIKYLTEAGMTYECYCSRREIQEAASAPNGAIPGEYPGTCRGLGARERAKRRSEIAAQGRAPALRLRSQVREWGVNDRRFGVYIGRVDDMVLRRSDGVAAYNLTSVVDDAYQGADQVVRADDLLTSAPRQSYLAHLLGLPEISEYWHVPLVLNTGGVRLAKRDGAVTLSQLIAAGWTIPQVIATIGESLGLSGSRGQAPENAVEFAEALAKAGGEVPPEPWVFQPPEKAVSR